MAKSLYFALEAPVVLVGLSLYYERATRLRPGTVRTLLASLGLSGVLGASWSGVFLVAASILRVSLSPDGRRVPVAGALVFGAFWGIVLCVTWAIGFIYPAAAEDARLRALEAEKHRLEAEKLKLEAERLRTAAELAHLRSQLEPHFLLNTLNAVAGLVTMRPKEARRLLGCLGDLLRDSLRDPQEMQTIGEEISWLRRYAEILESRHVGSLRFRWEVERATEGVLVPRLLLQPLVENAVNHGALQRSGEGEVLVRVCTEDGERVVCMIEDNGPGLPDGAPRSGAFGLRSVRRRLELKYEDATLRLESSTTGTRAIIRLPRDAGTRDA